MIKFHYLIFFANMFGMVYNAAMHSPLTFLNGFLMFVAWAEIELYYFIKNNVKDKDDEQPK